VKITKAPTWMSDESTTTTGGGHNVGGAGDGGLMLTIEGMGREKDFNAGVKATREKKVELEELYTVFSERLASLQSIVDFAEKGPAGTAIPQPTKTSGS